MGSDKRGNSFGSRRSLFGTEGSEVGLLLLGFGLRPLYLNPASLRILVYPETAKAVMERDRLDRKIRSVLLVDPTRPESGFVTEFRSGRRHYACRAFSLNDRRPKSGDAPVVALLFERIPEELLDRLLVVHQQDAGRPRAHRQPAAALNRLISFIEF